MGNARAFRVWNKRLGLLPRFFIVNLSKGSREGEKECVFMEKDYAKEIPVNVFKFYSLTNYNIDSFINQYLYLSHPYELNDLMDIRPYTLDMRNFTAERLETLKQEAIQYFPLLKKYFNIDNVDTHKEQGLYALQNLIYDSFFAFGGVISLASKDRFNELMWSHYAKESGFMMEFVTNNLLKDCENIYKNKLFNQIMFHPIQYKPHPCSIRCTKYSSLYEINKRNSYQKYIGWSYENEWRIVATSQQYLGRYNYYYSKRPNEFSLRRMYYSINSIMRVYLGKRFWTYDNFVVKDERIDNENKIRKYTLQEPSSCSEKERFCLFLQFVQKLNELKNGGINIYISGACDCGEFKFGTDICSKDNTFNPEYYYLTRSFEKIESINIDENIITVVYGGKHITNNSYWDEI